MRGPPPSPWTPLVARDHDVPAIEALIPVSVRGLQAAHHSHEQMEAAIGVVFAVDRQLVRDGTYYVVEDGGVIVGCGGWSARRTLYGGDAGRQGEDPALDPRTEPARIRAFFVNPSHARRGIGRSILLACESAAAAAGFGEATIVATLSGLPLYASLGYAVTGRIEVALPGGLSLPGATMHRRLSGAVEPPQEHGPQR
jgi:GNAT superfamily N-acetyltransferase